MSACDEGCPACWPALVKRAGKKGCTRPVNKPGALYDVGQISALCKQSPPSLSSRKLRREDAPERSWWTNKMIGGGRCKKHFCRQQLLWGDWGGASLWEAWEDDEQTRWWGKRWNELVWLSFNLTTTGGTLDIGSIKNSSAGCSRRLGEPESMGTCHEDSTLVGNSLVLHTLVGVNTRSTV